MLEIRVKVDVYGAKPDRECYVRLEVGEQGFNIMPMYGERDEGYANASASALHMATMLRKAIQRIIDEDSKVME